MEIYVVQPGDTINSIADRFGVTIEEIIRENELISPFDLTVGQTIVIAYPKQIHIVQEGDTIIDIAAVYGVSVMQILRNNPGLSGKSSILPGEVITISYNTTGSLITNGLAYAYIEEDNLRKTLPNLTFLAVYNYRISTKGEIVTYYDDERIIRLSKEYGTVPLMMVTTLSLQGEPDLELAYKVLLSPEYQEQLIDDILNIVKSRGYLGVNLLFNYMNETNQTLYKGFTERAANRIRGEGFFFFVTFNLHNPYANEIIIDNIDYSFINRLVDGLIFLQLIWGINYGPPAPVSNVSIIRNIVENVVTTASPEKIILGSSIISYDWRLPFIPGKTIANSLTIDSSLILARDTDSIIQFDEISMTPYFYYNRIGFGEVEQHIVWTIDARTINAFGQIVKDYNLAGTGIWNIMIYYAQLWLVLRAQFDFTKLLPDIYALTSAEPEES
jgi:spore germination protein